MKKMIVGLSLAAATMMAVQAGGDFAPAPTSVITPDDNNGWYVGGAVNYDSVYATDQRWFDDATDTQDQVGGLTAIAGYHLYKYLDLEARITKDWFKRDYSDPFHFSFFLKPKYDFRDEGSLQMDDGFFSVYGLLGFGYMYIEGYDGNTPANPTVIGKELMSKWTFQWGLGAAYTFREEVEGKPGTYRNTWTIFADYINYAHDVGVPSTYLYAYNPNKYDKLSVESINVGVMYHF